MMTRSFAALLAGLVTAVPMLLSASSNAGVPAGMDACNVVWESPSGNSFGSMPLGNGDIGINVWVEPSGDLLFYIAKVDAGFDSVKGRVELKIARQADRFQLALESPVGTRATVCIPLAEFGLNAVRVGDTTVWRNGKPVGAVPGLAAGPKMAGHATFIVEPGEWYFEAR